MLTYQDFLEEPQKTEFLKKAIREHVAGDMYKLAKIADEYDAQRNVTIYEYVRQIFTMTGTPVEDFTASNNRIASNFFHRLNVQRNTYLLGNGVSFTDNKQEVINEDGSKTTIDVTKEYLGTDFDKAVKDIAYFALIHAVCFGFWNVDKLHKFKLTEFVPLWDEETGSLRAGIRFWQLQSDKPMIAVLYEEDGYTKYKSEKGDYNFVEVDPKRAYKTIVRTSAVDGEQEVGESNYGSLPIIPMWGSRLHQSTIVGMQRAIDSYDLIRSGFANDLTDCAQIYWIIENCGGMDNNELARFRDRLKINHIAVADTTEGKVTPYTQEIPYQARQQYLDSIRAGIYEDFGALDVHTITAGATNDHIEAGYQPMDEEADDYEYQVAEFVQGILQLNGIQDTPVFKRNRISNEKEQTDMVLSASDYLDDETILQKLPFVTVDEVFNILAKKDMTEARRFTAEETEEGEE